MFDGIVDPVRVRRAGSLDLFDEDYDDLVDFRSHTGAGHWYERKAYEVLKRARRLYRDRDLRPRDRILLFERDGLLHAVTVFSAESERTALLGYIGVRAELHGARIDSEDGDRLSDAVLVATMDSARALGYERMTAEAATANVGAVRLMKRNGFELISRLDADYGLWAISVK